MTAFEKKVIHDMQEKFEKVRDELKDVKKGSNDFERLDTDSFFTEMYN